MLSHALYFTLLHSRDVPPQSNMMHTHAEKKMLPCRQWDAEQLLALWDLNGQKKIGNISVPDLAAEDGT